MLGGNTTVGGQLGTGPMPQHPLHVAQQALEEGRTHEALAMYQAIVDQEIDNPAAHHGLARTLWRLDRVDDAIEHLQRVAELSPNDSNAWSDLSIGLLVQKRIPEALKVLTEARKRFPNDPGLLLSLAAARETNREFEEALRLCKQVIQLYFSPGSPHQPTAAALCNLSYILFNNGMIAETIPFFRMALELEPHNVDALHSLSRALMSVGDLDAGFRGEEARFLWRDGKHYTHDPWNAEQLLTRPSQLMPIKWAAKHLVLFAEQGIGDELFFLRFVLFLRQQGAYVSYMASTKMYALIARSGHCDQVLTRSIPKPQADYFFPIGDAPLLAQCSWNAGPPPPLFIPALPEYSQTALTLLKDKPRPWIGLTWRAGTPDQRRELSKNIPLKELLQALAPIKGTWVILQRHPEDDEITHVKRRLAHVVDASAMNEEIEAIMGMLDVLDDYVGVSNTNMHLRAGLKKTGRVLMPIPADFRWMAKGEESPWFPRFKIYRATLGNRWTHALQALQQDLRKINKPDYKLSS
jgi:Flp pilus assembly protein TadD